ncbi:hypothetical protein BFG60_1742 [Microcystis aeruginosa NIES-98]|nr:hypothetical protein BFG60_1742 [Microcystis aeruginosa NIES-98]
MPKDTITQLVEVLIEAYLADHLGDDELRSIQEILENNKFKIKFDLAREAARRRWMMDEKC